MADSFRIKKGDLLPEITHQFKDASGNVVDLTGGAIKFSMWLVDGSSVKINAATAAIVTAATGQVKYTWAGTDTNTAGRYKGEFEATLSTKKLTSPVDTYISIIIIDDLG